MKKTLRYLLTGLSLTFLVSSCSEDLTVKGPEYTDDIWETRVYKAERHPTVIRNGFGMDMRHEGGSDHDVLYMTEETALEFPYDIMFSSDQAYSKNNAGEWTGSGNPVIFMAPDVRATIVGNGIDAFESFNSTDIETYLADLKSDPEIDIESVKHHHDDSCITDADGNYAHEEGFSIQSLIRAEYKKLIIGNKFRPNVGGVFECAANDPEQINLQPVFLIETKEKAYSVFMMTIFQGTGEDAQKATMTWRLIKI